jgi:signal transduction protein with GAF and PtsI domain
MQPHASWSDRLGGILREFNCQTGTLHQTAPDGRSLALVCQIGVPDFLLEKISLIPFGKGIAGAAAERREAVELCNLQQDLGGVARPEARQTGVSGSVAVPLVSAATGRVVGTLGIGKTEPYQFNTAEKLRLFQIAAEIAEVFEHNVPGGD